MDLNQHQPTTRFRLPHSEREIPVLKELHFLPRSRHLGIDLELIDVMSVSSYVIRLEGLPFRVTREELLDFFEDCDIHKGIDGVHLVMNRDGRASGMGYVELQSGEDVENALKKSQKNIGRHNR